MSEVIEQEFNRWAQGKTAKDARVAIYERIRDIPYAVIPELNDAARYVEILRLGKGSCTPKHMLLGDIYQRLGLLVLYAIYPFRWDEFEIDYPPKLRKLAKAMPVSFHLALKVDIEGKLVLVDATVDRALEGLGLPVNKEWDGTSDTLLPIKPVGEEQLYHPLEARNMGRVVDESSLTFYRELNSWLEEVRKVQGSP